MSAQDNKARSSPESEPQRGRKGGKRPPGRRRLLAYIAPAIVSSFLISPASAAPVTGCNPELVPCHPFR